MSIFDSPEDKAFKRFDDAISKFDAERERGSSMSYRAWNRARYLDATAQLAGDENEEEPLEAVVESAPVGKAPYTREELMEHTVRVHALTDLFAKLTVATSNIRELSALARSSRDLFASEVKLYESAAGAYALAAELAKDDARDAKDRELATLAVTAERKAVHCLELAGKAVEESEPKGGYVAAKPYSQDVGWGGAILGIIALLFTLAGYAGLVGFHLYTAWLINNANGPFWGVIAFLTPPASDLIWMGVELRAHGLISFYFGCLAAPLVAYAIGFAAFRIAGGRTS